MACKPKNDCCPNCGACQHCGRGGLQIYPRPYYPYQPYQPYIPYTPTVTPWYGPNEWTTITTDGTGCDLGNLSVTYNSQLGNTQINM